MSFVYDFLDLQVRTDQEFVPAAGGEAASKAANLYFKSAAVDTALSFITSALSRCEVKVFNEDKEDKGELYYLLNVRPNPNQNASQFITAALTKMLLEQECLIVMHKNRLYLADSFKLDERPLKNNRFVNVTVETEMLRKSFSVDDCIYLRYGNHRIGALVNGLYRDYGDLLVSAKDGFEKGAGSKWKLSIGHMQGGTRQYAERDEADRQDPSGQLKTFMGKANAVYIQHQGQDLQQFNTTGIGSDELISLRKELFETVATIFHIPPPMIFGNMTNIKDLTNSFLSYSIDPIADQLSKEFTAKFFSQEEWLNGSRISIDTTHVSHIDIFEIASSISQLIGAGFSLDEMRDATSWPRIGTPEAQEHLITRNFGALEEVLSELAGGGDNA